MASIPTLTDETDWTDELLDELRIAVAIEQERRYLVRTIPQQVEQQAEDYQRAIGRKDGSPWVQPVGGHDSYPPGAVVVLDGQAYRNDHAGLNPWEPGDVGAPWTPVWPDGDKWTTTPPAPTGGGAAAWLSGVAYKVGDKVTHDGATWECVLAHTSHDGWKPSAATHAVWKKKV